MGRTTVVIAHRLDTVRDVDQIVVLADGRVEAAGRHGELLDQSPSYRALLATHTAETPSVDHPSFDDPRPGEPHSAAH